MSQQGETNDDSESLNFAVLREVEARLPFMSAISAAIGHVSRDNAERVIREACGLRAWAEGLSDLKLRRLYLKWIDFAVRGAREAIQEFETHSERLLMDRYRSEQERVFAPVAQLRRTLPQPPDAKGSS